MFLSRLNPVSVFHAGDETIWKEHVSIPPKSGLSFSPRTLRLYGDEYEYVSIPPKSGLSFSRWRRCFPEQQYNNSVSIPPKSGLSFSRAHSPAKKLWCRNVSIPPKSGLSFSPLPFFHQQNQQVGYQKSRTSFLCHFSPLFFSHFLHDKIVVHKYSFQKQWDGRFQNFARTPSFFRHSEVLAFFWFSFPFHQ